MSLLMWTGFETGPNSAGVVTVAGTLTSTVGTVEVSSAVKRTGSYSFRSYPTTTATGYGNLRKRGIGGSDAALALTAAWVRAYVYIHTLPSSGSEEILGCYSSTAGDAARLLGIRVNSTGKLMAFGPGANSQLGSDGATTLSVDTWYRIEYTCGPGAAAAWEIKINGTTELSGTTDLGATNIDRVTFGKTLNSSSQTIDVYYDDVAIDSEAYIGAGQCTLLVPTGAGASTDWTGSYADVDDVPSDDDTSYLTTSTATHQSTFTMSDLATGGTIRGVSSIVKIREVTAGDTSTLKIVTNGVQSASTGDPGATYTYKVLTSLVDPSDSSAWTNAKVNSLTVGIYNTNATEVRCTSICAEVEYVPTPLAAGGLTEGTVTDASIGVTQASPTGGTSPYAYQWYRDAELLSGATTQNLTDNTVDAFTEYEYFCRITDDAEDTVDTDPITVKSEDTWADVDGATSSPYEDTGLTQDTTYEYRVKYTDEAPATVYSDPLIVTTLNIAAPTVTTTAASSVGNDSAVLGGEVTDDGGDTVTERGIVWNTTGDPTTSDNKVAIGTGTGSFSDTVTDLPAGTTIYYNAYATNSVGTSYGTADDFTTIAGDPYTTPAGTIAADGETLTLTWTRAGGWPVDMTGYNTAACTVTAGGRTILATTGADASVDGETLSVERVLESLIYTGETCTVEVEAGQAYSEADSETIRTEAVPEGTALTNSSVLPSPTALLLLDLV